MTGRLAAQAGRSPLAGLSSLFVDRNADERLARVLALGVAPTADADAEDVGEDADLHAIAVADFDVIVDCVGGATFGLAIEHVAPRGVVVNIATPPGTGTVNFRAACFDRAYGAAIYTLNLPDELAWHASAASDLTRLCMLAAEGRLDGQVELECSWRQADSAIDALLNRRIGGKAVLHVD